MPLSKCRHCGKMIPNPYHKYHEEKQCLVMRKRKGELWLTLPHVEPPKSKEDEGQTKLLEFGVHIVV